jgi:uncharacterized protein (DUF2267 family)
MSAGLPVFDTTVQQSNEWLKLVESRLPPCGRQGAYEAFRAVLHVLRDRLPIDAVLGLSAQLPILLRGVYFEGWRPQNGPTKIHDRQVFADAVAAQLPPNFPRQADDVIEAVFAALGARLDPGESRKLVQHLPIPLRTYWPFEHRIA